MTYVEDLFGNRSETELALAAKLAGVPIETAERLGPTMHYAINEYNIGGRVFLQQQHGVFSTRSGAEDWLAERIHFRSFREGVWENTLAAHTNLVYIVLVSTQIWV